jgi:hypothetical protein
MKGKEGGAEREEKGGADGREKRGLQDERNRVCDEAD